MQQLERFVYHVSCYRQFTDIPDIYIYKLERAKQTQGNRVETVEDDHGRKKEDSPPVAKARKSLRQSLGQSASNVLPKICLICKKNGPIYITDKVSSRLPKIKNESQSVSAIPPLK